MTKCRGNDLKTNQSRNNEEDKKRKLGEEGLEGNKVRNLHLGKLKEGGCRGCHLSTSCLINIKSNDTATTK